MAVGDYLEAELDIKRGLSELGPDGKPNAELSALHKKLKVRREWHGMSGWPGRP
jgi:hypothetical protein